MTFAESDANSQPLVSIGIPVYNGERFLSQTLQSLQDQDYKNLELIICDNGSSDGTATICREHQSMDYRMQYYRSETNMGAIQNFNRAFELAVGKYFMWAGAHDLWAESYVSQCTSILEREPTVALAYSRTMLIDLEGNPIGLMPDQIDTRGMTPAARYAHLIRNLRWCNMIHGVIRRESLTQTRLFKKVFGTDHLLLAELSLTGAFAQISEPLFFRRQTRPDENVDRDPDGWKQQMIVTLDPGSKSKWGKTTLTDLYRTLRNEHIKLIQSSSLNYTAKLRMLLETLRTYQSNFGVDWPGGRLLRKVWTNRLSDSVIRRIAAA